MNELVPECRQQDPTHDDGADAAHLLHAELATLSDPSAQYLLYNSESMRRYAWIGLVEASIPDETTILRFRHLLDRHQLAVRIFREFRTLL